MKERFPLKKYFHLLVITSEIVLVWGKQTKFTAAWFADHIVFPSVNQRLGRWFWRLGLMWPGKLMTFYLVPIRRCHISIRCRFTKWFTSSSLVVHHITCNFQLEVSNFCGRFISTYQKGKIPGWARKRSEQTRAECLTLDETNWKTARDCMLKIYSLK